MSFGGETVANQLLAALMAGEDITIPQVDLTADIYKIPGGIDSEQYQPVRKLTNDDLTTRVVDGDGTFDALMAGFSAHLKIEYEKGRITGAEYTKAFIALTEGAMANAVQYLLGRDNAFWQAVIAQAQAITARVQLETAKVQYAALQLEAMIGRANYALTKLKLATEDVTYGQGKYNLDNILPLQKIGQEIQNSTGTYNLNQMLPAQKQGQDLQNAGQTIQNSTGKFNLDFLLPLQRTGQELQNAGQTIQNNTGSYQLANIFPQQLNLLREQTEVQRAQTLDVRMDGATVTGAVGKQKDLYSQQITSYQRNSELSAARVFSDAWITQKTIDEGLLPPDALNNNSVNAVLNMLKTNNNLG